MRRTRVAALLLALGLAGCGAAASTATAPLPTPAPPTAVTTGRSWEAGPVIARFDQGACGDSCVGQVFSPMPQAILYSDGRLVFSSASAADARTSPLQQRQLSQQEVCAFLNTVDQSGFWNVDMDAYAAANAAYPRMQVPQNIAISAWNSRAISASGLEDYLPGGALAGKLAVPAGLRVPLLALQQLEQGPAEPYTPAQIAVYVESLASPTVVRDAASDAGAWPLADPALADLAAQADDQHMLVLPATAPVWELFERQQRGPGRIYTAADGQQYVVAVQALWPLQSSGGSVYTPASIPDPAAAVNATVLACSSADGTLPIK